MGFFGIKRGLFTTSVVLITLFLQSCSSLFYSDTLRKRNNTFQVTSNQPNYKVVFSKVGGSNVSNYNNSIHIDKLNRKRTFFTFSAPGCYDINVRVKRVPRVGAVLLDLPLSIFFLAPYAVDVFKPDFYKISRGSKLINLQFQRTPQYFREKMTQSLSLSNTKILDSLLLDNPSDSLKIEISKLRLTIYKNNINRDLEVRRNDFDYYTMENFNFFKNKFNDVPKECQYIIDSVRLIIEEKEMESIIKKSDLIRLIQLQKISDPSFNSKLKIIKPQIDSIVLKSISKNYEFDKLNRLISLESPEESSRLISFKNELEKKSILEISQTNDLSLLISIYYNVGQDCRNSLDSIRPSVEKFNDIKLLKRKIEDIKNEIKLSNYNKALDLINKSYPNSFPDNSPENKILKDLLVKTKSSITQETVSNLISEYKNDMLKGMTIGDVEMWNLKQLLESKMEVVIYDTLYRNKTPNGRVLDYNDYLLMRKSSYYVDLSSTELSPTQKNEISTIIKGFEVNKKKWIKDREASQKQIDEINNYYGINNKESNNSSNQSKVIKVLCATESGYDYVSYFKLTLYQDGSASMDKDGKILIGTWYENNGSIISKINKYYLKIEKPYGENYYMDSSRRMWNVCF
jgi:hypothetical protein